MSLELTKEDLIEAAARGFERAFSKDEYMEKVIEGVAAKVANLFELLSPEVAAGLIGSGVSTLRKNAVDWGLDKSVAFGPEYPQYFLSQIIERAQAKVIKGARTGASIVAMPDAKKQRRAC